MPDGEEIPTPEPQIIKIDTANVKTMKITCKGSCGIPEFTLQECCVVEKFTFGCVQSVNPSGKNIPASPGGGSFQNPDGFYTFSLTNNCDNTCIPHVHVSLADGEGNMFEPIDEIGPVSTCDTVKYTQWADNKDKSLKVKKMGSDPSKVKYHLLGGGELSATIEHDGTTYKAECKVPKPPARV
jgi:hypothetical protein